MPAKGATTTAPPEPAGRDAAVRLDAVSMRYGAVEALAGVTLDVARDDVVALVGPSGCGKSTLLDLVCGLASPTSGSVLSEPAVLMPQRDGLLPWLSALDNAALPLRLQGASRDAAQERATSLLERLGLPGFAAARPHELSGGMRQRVAFARTLLANKPVLALDEPFNALDALTRTDMHRWLTETLEQEPRTVLLVTHDVEEALVLADRVLVLSPRPGRIVDELHVDLPRPRTPTDPRIVALRERALGALA